MTSHKEFEIFSMSQLTQKTVTSCIGSHLGVILNYVTKSLNPSPLLWDHTENVLEKLKKALGTRFLSQSLGPSSL